MSQIITVRIKFNNEPSNTSIKNFSRVLEDIYSNSDKLPKGKIKRSSE